MWPVETCQAHIYFGDIGHPHSADTHPDSQHNVLYRLVSIHASYKGIIILYRSNTGVRIYHTSLIGVTRLERAPSWSQIKRSTNWPTPRYLEPTTYCLQGSRTTIVLYRQIFCHIIKDIALTCRGIFHFSLHLYMYKKTVKSDKNDKIFLFFYSDGNNRTRTCIFHIHVLRTTYSY